MSAQGKGALTSLSASSVWGHTASETVPRAFASSAAERGTRGQTAIAREGPASTALRWGTRGVTAECSTFFWIRPKTLGMTAKRRCAIRGAACVCTARKEPAACSTACSTWSRSGGATSVGRSLTGVARKLIESRDHLFDRKFQEDHRALGEKGSAAEVKAFTKKIWR